MKQPVYIKLLAIMAISCLGIIVYSNSFFCPFQFDDMANIINNFFIRNMGDLYGIWSSYPGRFITFLSFAFSYHFYQFNVFGYHLFNLTVHLASAILVWWLVLLTLSTPALKEDKITRHAGLIAFLAGLIFVSHPLQTEAVTYIWQRAASMMALFYLMSLCFYVKSRLLQDDKSGRFYYMGALIMAVAAMFTKENAISLPLMVLLYEISFFNLKKALDWKRLFLFLLTLLVIPVTTLLTKSERFQEIQRIATGPNGISPAHYFLTQLRVMVTYLRLVFLPINQNVDYDYPYFKSIFEAPVFCSFLFLLGILYCAKRLFLKYRLVSFSILWFFLTLLPESSFVPQKDLVVEHRLYLPLAGYSLFLVSSLYYLWGKNFLQTMVVVLLMIIACNSVLTYQRNKVWKDEFALWNDTVQKSARKARPYNNRGEAYYNKGDFIDAISNYNKSIGIDPNSAEAYYNRGNAYSAEGNFTRAMSDYNKAILIDPGLQEAYANRGNEYYHQGKLIEAMSDQNKAIELNPNSFESYYNRALIDDKQGNFIQAISDYNKAIELNPEYAEAYNNRGNASLEAKDMIQAISDYNKAIELNPDFADAYYNRAIVYYQLKKYDKAGDDLNKAEALGIAADPGFTGSLKAALGEAK